MYTICIADDEALVVEGLVRKVDWKRLDTKVVGTAKDGREALEMIQRLQPDLALIDIRMPSLTGLQVMEALGSKSATTCIVFSGYDDFHYAQAALRLGTVDYLIKPSSIAEIEHAIVQAQERHQRAQLLSAVTEGTQGLMERQILMLLDGREVSAHGLDRFSAFVIVLIRFIGDPPPEAETFALSFKRLERSGERLVLVIRSGTQLIVIGAVGRGDVMMGFRRDLQLKLQELHKGRSRGTQWYWAMGKVCDSVASLRDSFTQTGELLEYALFTRCQPEGNAFVLDKRQEGNAQLVQEVCDRLAKAVDEVQVRTALEGYFARIVKEQVPIGTVKGLCVELVFALRCANVPLSGGRARDSMEMNPAVMEAVMGCGSVPQLTELLVAQVESMRKSGVCGTQSYREMVIAAIHAYINEHLDQPITLHDIAEHIHMNQAYVSHLFKKETTDNLFEYITSRRIDRACLLLRTTFRKIHEICASVGYEDQRYFCQVFKKRMGMTALEYRTAFHKGVLEHGSNQHRTESIQI
jgi:two-component system response regulator YesN